VSNAPVVDFAECTDWSRFIHVTDSPTLTVTDCGTNWKFWIETVCDAASAASGAPTRNSETAAARIHDTIRECVPVTDAESDADAESRSRRRRSHEYDTDHADRDRNIAFRALHRPRY